MIMQNKLTVVRTLAGEGNFHAYKLLDRGARLFLVAKYLRTSLNYWRGRRTPSTEMPTSIAYIKGANQLRHYNETRSLIESRIGAVEPYFETNPSLPNARILPRISTKGLIQQIWFLLLMLVSGRRRYLNQYYIAFYEELHDVLSPEAFSNVRNFVCFNDQPYDAAALVLIFRTFDSCRTIVLQHGLILSPQFGFPTNAHEFWAWGHASLKYFKSRSPDTQLIVTGRRMTDAIVKSVEFRTRQPGDVVSLVIAPSFYHNEIMALVKRVAQSKLVIREVNAKLVLKLHPATKFRFLIRFRVWQVAPWIHEETSSMDALANLHSGLITMNSSSSVDFLLRGKPVFFESMDEVFGFPSRKYGFVAGDLEPYVIQRNSTAIGRKNIGRIKFLKDYLHV